jgi:hypothetical protein
MGPTALLPLQRKSCYGFFSPLRIHRPRPGLSPRTLDPVASTLPLDHRGRMLTKLCVLKLIDEGKCPRTCTSSGLTCLVPSLFVRVCKRAVSMLLLVVASSLFSALWIVPIMSEVRKKSSTVRRKGGIDVF